jgi:peptidoglycan/LPS O-acetylase OafA/YrhL
VLPYKRETKGHDSPFGNPKLETVQKRSIDCLTGIRFFAAAWVVLTHFRVHVESLFPTWRAMRPFTESGFLGVDLFFILSGFIISLNYLDTFRSLRTSDYLRFLGMRLARIYPVHLVTMMVLLPAAIGAGYFRVKLNRNYGAGDFVGNFFLLNAWTVGKPTFSWNYPAWSISAEWFAYLLFPIVAVPMTWVRKVWMSASGAVLAIMIYMLLLPHGGGPGSPIVRIACEFVAGMFLARLFVMSSGRGMWNHLSILTIISVPCVLWFAKGITEQRLLVAAFAMLIISLAHSKNRLARFLATRKLVFLGEVSYSLYMTHAIVEMFGAKLASMESAAGAELPVRLLILSMYILVTLGAAIGMFLLVERPARDQLRSLVAKVR